MTVLVDIDVDTMQEANWRLLETRRTAPFCQTELQIIHIIKCLEDPSGGGLQG